jgi:hypothetical protein
MAIDAHLTISHADLLDALQSVPALELQSVILLREYHATGVFPSREQVIGATEELVAYTRQASGAAAELRKLTAIPAGEAALVETYSL